MQGKPLLRHGRTDQHSLLPVPGETFALRKLLPQTADYDFNIHIMDFRPGEYLNVKASSVNHASIFITPTYFYLSVCPQHACK